MNEYTDDGSWRTVADAVCADLGAVIARAIPEAVELENVYWTVSDFPSTVGGRLATLNVGTVEVLFVQREPYDLIRGDGEPVKLHCSRLNTSAGTALTVGELQTRWQTSAPFLSNSAHPAKYGTGPVDNLTIPTGFVGQALDHPVILQGVREFCLNLMRSSQSGLFRRWHSRELTRRAYEEHTKVIDSL